MTRRWLIAAVLVLPLLAGAAVRLGERAAPAAAGLQPLDSLDAAARAVVGTDKAIRLFEDRVRERPADYLSYTILGQLHARRARETGDFDAYTRAEDAFRKALDARKDHQPASLGLAAALASQHKFADALGVAGAVRKANPGSVDALAVVGDAFVEVGNYADAAAAFDELRIRVPDAPSVLARIAHLAELRGQRAKALDLLRRAGARELDEEGHSETTAWYQTRIGALLYRDGKLDGAAESFETALRYFDGYYIALDGLAEVRVAQGNDADAIALLERATSRVPQPASLIDLGDLYAKHGRTADAERAYRQAESIALRGGSYQFAYRRDLAMFYADHNRQLARALELAREDLESRPDIYGYDALAWCLYRNGRFDEAAPVMEKALVLGSGDATLLSHAGLIDYRRGRLAQARERLTAANARAPYLLKDEAKHALADLASRTELPR